MKLALLALPILLMAAGIAQYNLPGSSTQKVDVIGNLNKTAPTKTTIMPFFITNPEKQESTQLSDRAQDVLKTKTESPANFSSTTLTLLDLSKFDIVIEEDGYDILNTTFFVNNPESIKDVLNSVIEHGHKGKSHHQSGSSQTASSSSSFSSSSSPAYRIIVQKIPPGTQIQDSDRPEKQQKSLGQANCGIDSGRFSDFERKHVIQPGSVSINQFGGLAYLTAVLNRIEDPYEHFSFFFIDDVSQIGYKYNEKNDKCVAQTYHPVITCQRQKDSNNKLSDHLGVCYFTGNCTPTYYKANGHMARLQCQNQPEFIVPDFLVSLAKIQDLQDQFANNYIKAPPTELDYELALWRGRRWSSIRNTGSFNEDLHPKPVGPITEREVIYQSYQKALREHRIDSMPEEVLRIFYNTPRIYISSLPHFTRHGLIVIGNTMVSANLNYREVNLQSIPPAPGSVDPPPAITDDEYPVLGAGGGRQTRRPQRSVTEYQANTTPDVHQETSEVASRIVRELFPAKKEKQIVPSPESLRRLYET